VLEAVLGFELLELWQAPARAELARRELDATILAIAFEAAQALEETRHAYFQAVYAEAAREFALEEGMLLRRQVEVARERVNLGVADRLELNAAELAYSQVGALYSGFEVAAGRTRSELARKLSIRDTLADTDLIDSLKEAAGEGVDHGLMRFLVSRETVETGLESRLDLQALAMTSEALRSRIDWEESRIWPQASGGIAFESTDAGDEIGPALSMQLPILDRNQAQIARAELLLSQSELLLEQACIDVEHDIRDAVQRFVKASYNLDGARHSLVAEAQDALELAEQARAAGSATTEAVLAARMRQLSARRVLLQLKLEVVLAKSALEREIGQPISSAYSGSDK
jgi:outer membrane protein TolC